MRPSPPAERVRARFARKAGPEAAQRLPAGYQRLGRVLLLRLPDDLEPFFVEIGRLWQEELGVETVLRIQGPVSGDYRAPGTQVLAGHSTETEVIEYGVRYALDASRILFARGNRTERHRVGGLVRPGETVVDLFAGIGYFAIPAALHGAARVHAIEVNPLSFRYLELNVRSNGVERQVRPILGDNRAVPLPAQEANRVLLGILPTSLPWTGLAVSCLKAEGGWLHCHLVADVREPPSETAGRVARACAPALVTCSSVRDVKPYGPGRAHRVVDAFVRREG
jgi:tRNA wybutosine-synthesizing protein 2